MFLLGLATFLVTGAMAALTPANSIASYGCGSFNAPGILTRVHVKVVNGSVACATARGVMKWAFSSYEYSYVRYHHGWRVLGPQTCSSSATKGWKTITGQC